MDVSKLIGLSEKEALDVISQNGFKARIDSKDGESFMGTCDYRLDRVKLSVYGGKVTTANIG